MSLTIQEPIKTVNGLLTTTIAAETQALYSIHRQDFVLNAISTQNGNAAVKAADIVAGIPLGSIVYVKATLIPSGLYTVIGSASTNYLEINYPYTAAEAPDVGTVNDISAKDNYRMEIEVRDKADSLSLFDTVFVYIPNQAGDLDLDVGQILTSYIKTKGGGFSFEYFLRVQEVWEGSSESSIDTNVLQAVVAFKQLLSTGGANMWENLLRQTGVATGNSLGKLLTKFENPKLWLGWNRTVSMLVDANLVSRTLNSISRLIQEPSDINKNLLLLGEVIGPSFDGVDVHVIPIANTRLNVKEQYRKVFIKTNDLINIISEPIFYRITSECNNPIMLDWVNSLGGVDQWLFENSQQVQVISDSGVVAERPTTTDIEFITRTKRRFANTFRQHITLRAKHLTTDQLLALQEIKQTESLRVYLSKDGTKFIDGIIVTSFTTDYNRKNSTHSFVVIVELPDGFKFEDGKLY